MKKILVWETSASVSGGQKMTLMIMDMLRKDCEFLCLIPGTGLMADELKKRNIPYAIIGDQTLPAGVKGINSYFRYAWISVKSILRSLRQILCFHPDVLYAPGPASLPWSAVCGSLTGRPVVWHLHHLFTDGPTKRLLNVMSKWNSVKRIICVSNTVGEQIKDSRGRKKLYCVYNPIEISRYANGDRQKAISEIEKSAGNKFPWNEMLVLMQIAILRRSKCQDQFLQVITELKKTGIPVCGILVGGPITEEDRLYMTELQEYIKNNNLSDCAVMMGQRNNVEDYLAVADSIFVPSTEGLSLAALEAMAAKCKVISTEIGGAGELLCVSGGGYVYPKDATPERIAKIVEQAWKDNEDRTENGYAFCLEHNPKWYQAQIRELFVYE